MRLANACHDIMRTYGLTPFNPLGMPRDLIRDLLDAGYLAQAEPPQPRGIYRLTGLGVAIAATSNSLR